MASSEAAADIGHNNPPEPTLKERIEETYSLEFAKIEPIAARVNALPKAGISDDTVLGQFADVVTDASKLVRQLEGLRKIEKEPFLRDGKIVDATFTEGRIKRLETISDKLTLVISNYNRDKTRRAREEQVAREREIRQREEQARLDAAMEAEAGNHAGAVEHIETAQHAKAEAREAAAPIKAADVTRVRSESGTTITTRTEVKARILDWEKVDLNKLRAFIKPEHVEQALRAFVRINKKNVPIEGVEFYDDETALLRT